VDGVRDKDEDAVDVIERGLGPLEGEEMVCMTGGGNGNNGGGGAYDIIEVVIVSVIVKLPKLVNGETLGRRIDVSKEISRPS
jgi:hypothetical protein